MVKKHFTPYLTIALLWIINSGYDYTYGQSVDTIEVYSPSMHKSIKNIIITPADFDMSTDSFPAVYILHGAGGDFGSWLADVPWFPSIADKYGFVLVLPDGGSTSWYFDSPVDTSYRYATYISEELTTYVERNYKVLNDAKKRATTGLHMGGHGAFYLAAMFPGIWGNAGSICGGLDFRAFTDSWNLDLRLGAKEKHTSNWEANTVINMLDLFKNSETNLIFDCGIQDLFCEANKNVHNDLITKCIPHTFISRPGQHDSNYWSSALEYQLLFFKKHFYNKKS